MCHYMPFSLSLSWRSFSSRLKCSKVRDRIHSMCYESNLCLVRNTYETRILLYTIRWRRFSVNDARAEELNGASSRYGLVCLVLPHSLYMQCIGCHLIANSRYCTHTLDAIRLIQRPLSIPCTYVLASHSPFVTPYHR